VYSFLQPRTGAEPARRRRSPRLMAMMRARRIDRRDARAPRGGRQDAVSSARPRGPPVPGTRWVRSGWSWGGAADPPTTTRIPRLFVRGSTTGGRAGESSTQRRTFYRGLGKRTSEPCLYAPDMHDPDLIHPPPAASSESRTTCCAGRPTRKLLFRDELWPDFLPAPAFEQSLDEFRRPPSGVSGDADCRPHGVEAGRGARTAPDAPELLARIPPRRDSGGDHRDHLHRPSAGLPFGTVS